MTDTLIHRGPDGEGTWLSDEQNIGFGHRRLSIIDVSESGRQPMHYLDRYTITFNGEIYNYIELKQYLEKNGYKFNSQSDTEVLLALYDQKKEKALALLDGMFAFAIWDKKEKTLFCARDRFGEKPFFFFHTAQQFIFASEIKALLAAGVPNKINTRKIYSYFLYSVFEDQNRKDETFFDNIHRLEASHYLLVGPKGHIKKEKYWTLDVSKRIRLADEEYYERFGELLTLSVSRRLRSDVPVGSSLSGGLDSSTIVMIIDNLKKKNAIQKTFSARFKGYVKDEGFFMEKVINKTRVDPHFIYPGIDSVFANLEKIHYHQEEPVGTASVAIQYEVMKAAHDNQIKVLLDGQGADETLAGYSPYWRTYFTQLYRTNKKLLLVEEEAYRNLHGDTPYVNDFDFKWRAWNITSYNAMSDIKRKFIPATATYFLGIHPDIVHQCRSEPNPIRKFNSLKQHLYFSTFEKGLNELLRYADRNSMANSVEVRLPFLFHELVEFAFAVPEDKLLYKGWSKYILRESMKDLLPTEIAWRKDKIGYEPPQEQWITSKTFIDYYHTAVDYLQKEKIITKTYPDAFWRYMSLYSFLVAFKN